MYCTPAGQVKQRALAKWARDRAYHSLFGANAWPEPDFR